jgi:hypothetical protein
VVENHVEHHFDAVAVQLLDQVLELVHLHAEGSGGGEAGLGREEANRAVAPVVVHHLAGERVGAAVLELVELEDRHQLDAVHPQLLQIGDLRRDAGIGAGVLDACRGMSGETARVQFVDHQVGERRLQGAIVFPVEILEDQSGTVRVAVVPVGCWPHCVRPPIALA